MQDGKTTGRNVCQLLDDERYRPTGSTSNVILQTILHKICLTIRSAPGAFRPLFPTQKGCLLCKSAYFNRSKNLE